MRAGQARMASKPYAEPTVPGEVAPAGQIEPSEPPIPGGLAAEEIEGRSPWYLAYLRLRRNKVALAFGTLFIVIVLDRAERAAHSRRARGRGDRGPKPLVSRLSAAASQQGRARVRNALHCHRPRSSRASRPFPAGSRPRRSRAEAPGISPICGCVATRSRSRSERSSLSSS